MKSSAEGATESSVLQWTPLLVPSKSHTFYILTYFAFAHIFTLFNVLTLLTLGHRVAIKKITNVFDHVSDATRILRETKLLRLFKHNDIVEIKHILLPPNPQEYKDIYVVFELMETDLHQVYLILFVFYYFLFFDFVLLGD